MPSPVDPTATGIAQTSVVGRALGIGLVLTVLAVGAFVLLRRIGTPLPIPVPTQLGQLDAQVREHLTVLARQVAQAPADPERRVELGLGFAVNGLWPQARQCFLDATHLGFKGPLPVLYAAVARQESGDSPGALAELRDLVKQHPAFAPGWYRLGFLLTTAGEFKEASEAYEKVTHLAPNEWRGWAGLGETRLASGRAAEAVAPLEMAIQLDPFARSARQLLSQAYRATGRIADADREAAAGRAPSIGPMPDDWSMRALPHMKGLPDQFEQADQYLARGEGSMALRLLEEARRFHPTNTVVLRRLSLAYLAVGRAEDASALLADALAKFPNEVSLILAAAEVAAADNRADDALALSRRALELAPRLAEAHVAEANALLAGQHDAEAAAALGRALELDPRNTTLLIQLGDVQRANLNQPSAALDTYTRALASDPIHPVALERLASLHLQRREFEAAAGLIQRWRALEPTNPAVDQIESDLAAARHR